LVGPVVVVVVAPVVEQDLGLEWRVERFEVEEFVA
jgi:hypothetical protein